MEGSAWINHVVWRGAVFVCAAALFGLIFGYEKTGSYSSIYWAQGIADTIWALVLALLWAGGRKQFSRDVNFLNSWLAAFLIFSALFLISLSLQYGGFFDA